jgi:hypothetical protein
VKVVLVVSNIKKCETKLEPAGQRKLLTKPACVGTAPSDPTNDINDFAPRSDDNNK